MSENHLAIDGPQLLLNGAPFLPKGLRCSNALIDDAAADQLIENLPVFVDYGVNSLSVFLMGSRFGDVRGYAEDGALDPVYRARFDRILQAADDQALMMIVGCLYWGTSQAKWPSWTQHQANAAIANTARWLAEAGWQHTIVDVDNEGMGLRQAGFDNRELVLAAKAAAPEVLVGTNYRGEPPEEADLALHFATPVSHKPYIESEGSPQAVEGGYWGPYSKREGFYGYLNVGVYTPAMRADQCRLAEEYFERGHGYYLASTWLQAGRPQGPNQRPGGMGTADDPGVRWWLEWLRGWLAEHEQR